MPATTAFPPHVSLAGPGRPLRHPAFGLFAAYGLFIVYATLLPFQFVSDRATLDAKARYINWNPLRMVNGEPTPLTDLVSNVVLFVPLGLVGFYAQRRRAPAVALLRCTAAGFALSTSVEAVQYFTPARNPAVSDVVTNVLGTLLGGLLSGFFQMQLRGPLLARAHRWARREPLLLITLAYAMIVMLSALVPFDIDPTIGWLKHALRTMRMDPIRDASPWADQVPGLLQYAVLWGLAYQVATRLRWGRAPQRFVTCVVVSGCMALGLEVAQLLVRSRVASARDVLGALAGGVAGVTIAAAIGNRRAARHGWTLVGMAYMACLCLQALQPYVFQFEWPAMRARLSQAAFVPYSSYYYKANVAAVADFLEALLGYVPLGFVLARLRSRRAPGSGWRPGLTVTLLCGLYALALEVLQLGVPRRYPEISDVLTAALGGGLGAYAWRWMEHLSALARQHAAAHREPMAPRAPSEWETDARVPAST